MGLVAATGLLYLVMLYVGARRTDPVPLTVATTSAAFNAGAYAQAGEVFPTVAWFLGAMLAFGAMLYTHSRQQLRSYKAAVAEVRGWLRTHEPQCEVLRPWAEGFRQDGRYECNCRMARLLNPDRRSDAERAGDG